MSGRYEITNREDGISITSPDGIVDQLIASDPEDGQCLDDAVIGAIRQQARDLEQLRADLAAAVARAEQAEARLAAIDAAPTVGWLRPYGRGLSTSEPSGERMPQYELIARPAKD